MITSKQRAYLRSMANTMETIFQIGKGGIGDNFNVQIDEALKARELIKIRVLESAGISPKEAAVILADAVSPDIVQVIGSRITLYRRNAENAVIKLPR